MKRPNFFFLIFLVLWIFWITFWAWALPYNMGPDECLHFKTAQFFQTHQGLPIAGKDDITFIREPGCVGTTYISTPFLNYIIISFFIPLGNLFGIERDYLAARMSSIFFGLIFVFFFYLLLKKMFKKNVLLVFTILISTIFIPQVTYVFSYLNHETYSLASSSFLLFATYSFFINLKEHCKIKYFLLLGLAVALQLFAKSNFYLLLLIPAIILPYGFRRDKKIYLKNLFALVLLILILSGWFFLRNYLLYKDLLGVKTYQSITRSNFGTRTYAQAGWNFYDVLFKSQWLEETASSFYGRFGYMTIEIDPVMQWIFRGFVFLGIVGLIKKTLEVKNFRSWLKEKIFFVLFVFLIPANITISLYNSLYFDFQNQGRYLFPILMPLMILVNLGLFGLVKNRGSQRTLAIAITTGSLLLNFWSFLYLPKI